MNDEIRTCMLLHGWDDADVTQIIQHESRVYEFQGQWPGFVDDPWAEHDVYTVELWQEHVNAGNTRMGYWEWALSMYEQERANDSRLDAKEETS